MYSSGFGGGMLSNLINLYLYKIYVETITYLTIVSLIRGCESIFVGEALAPYSRLKPLQNHIRTEIYEIKNLFLRYVHNTFTVSIA